MGWEMGRGGAGRRRGVGVEGCLVVRGVWFGRFGGIDFYGNCAKILVLFGLLFFRGFLKEGSF